MQELLAAGFVVPDGRNSYLDQHGTPIAAVRLNGNLCRCTGYVGIVESILAAAEKMHGH